MDKIKFYIDKYNSLKKLNSGKKPLINEFLKYCQISEFQLMKIFGKDPYSTLQEKCGDKPNKLQMERTLLSQILNQYGKLTRKYRRIPVIADWLKEDLHPRPAGLKKVHNISFRTLPEVFIENYKDKIEWKDVIKILTRNQGKTEISNNYNKTFLEVIEKINNWIPERKRIIEEGYKIELRKYLKKYFKDVDEEMGESNVDLLVNKKYPIEIKKDPSQSEYDRLLGQMIRHNSLYGNATAVITGISSEDRYKKFRNLFGEVKLKLSMKAEIFNK